MNTPVRTFRIPDKSIKKLKELAKEENRSQANMLVVMIDEKFKTLK